MRSLRLVILLVFLLPLLPSAAAAGDPAAAAPETGFECKGPEGKPTACVCAGAITSPSCQALTETGYCRGTHYCCVADHENDVYYCWCEQGGCSSKRNPIGQAPPERTIE